MKERSIISNKPNKEPAISRIRMFSAIIVKGIKNILVRITNFIVIKTLCLIKCLLSHKVITFYILLI